MRTYRGKGPKVLILVLVCVLLGGFSIGFSAISQSLLIKPHASIKPEVAAGSFNVKFSTTSSGINQGSVAPTTTPTGLAATNAEITGDTTISNFSVELNNPGDVIKYEFYAINDGNAPAYLTEINLNNVSGESLPKVCSAIYGSTDTDASTLCDYINLTVQVGDITATTSTSVTEHPLAAAASEKVTITISFKTGLSDSQLTELGDVIVEFGDISLIYTQVDGSDSETDTATCSLANLDGSIDTSDVVTCGTENFYVMSNDGTNVEMLAKYNLDVGNIFIRDWSDYDNDVFDTTTIPSSPTYGMQNEKAVGYKEIDGKDYNYGVLDETEAATAISNYGTLLKGLLSIDELVASVPTAEQMKTLGCTYNEADGGSCENAPAWVYSTNYWLTDGMSIGTYSDPYFENASYTWASMYGTGYGSDESLVLGARPVVTILNDYITVE